MTFEAVAVVAGEVFSSVAARPDVRLDMMFPSLSAVISIYGENRIFVTAKTLTRQNIVSLQGLFSGHKNASRGLPGSRSRVWRYDAGIRTVSITWMTPFDWLTFVMVT